MSATEQFIKDIVAGGWNPYPDYGLPQAKTWGIRIGGDGTIEEWRLHRLLLDPLAWQAVGKVEGWKSTTEDWWKTNYQDRKTIPTHVYMMHRMIDALAKGKSVEEFLSAL